MNDVRENRLLSRWAEILPRDPRQTGAVHEADAELLPLPGGSLLALTIDAVDEEVKAGLYRSSFTVGRTAAVAALSDLAATGAEPLGLLLSAALPAADLARSQDGVARGVGEVCRDAGVHVLGGDTSEGDALSVTCAAAGLVPHGAALLRCGLRPGDRLYASAPLGVGSALAAARWLRRPEIFPEEAYRPAARLAWGRALRGVASACMDTSDGLLATLDQLARLNDVALRVETPLQALLAPAADRVRRQVGLTPFTFLAGQHGEFELVFGVRPEKVRDLECAAAELGWEPLLLGQVERGFGLFLGDRRVDGGRIRDLLHEVGGDLSAYVRVLESMEVTACSESSSQPPFARAGAARV